MERVIRESMKTAEAHAQANKHTVKMQHMDHQAQAMTQLNAELIKYEPLNPDQRLRNNFEPIGLKNVGNSKIQYP